MPKTRSLVSITTDPEGATVTLRRNGRVIAQGKTPFEPTIEAGDYEITIDHKNFAPLVENVTVTQGVLSQLRYKISTGEALVALLITSNPSGASIYIDSREAGEVAKTPHTVAVSPGKHTIYIERPGFRGEKRTIILDKGDSQTVTVGLTRTQNGFIRVVGTKGAKILLDNKEVGTIPWEGPAPAGVRKLRVVKDGYTAWEDSVLVGRGKQTRVLVDLGSADKNEGVWILGGITVAVFAVAIGFGVASDNLNGQLAADLKRQDPTMGDPVNLASDDPRISKGETFALVANISFIAAGASALLALVFFLIDGSQPSHGQVRKPKDFALSPYVSPSSAGGFAQWSF